MRKTRRTRTAASRPASRRKSLTSFFSSKARETKKKRSAPKSRRAHFEPLEERALLSVTVQDGSSYPSHFTDLNGTLLFAAQDDSNGHELWKASEDVTGVHATQVKDINTTPDGLGTKSAEPYSLTDVGGTLFFLANNGTDG